MRVSNLLTAKGSSIATIPPDSSVASAVDELRRHGIGALVVSSDKQHIEGIISERDIVRALAGEGAGALLEETVSSIMSKTVTTCSPDDEIVSLMTTMTNLRIRHVPVVSDEVLVGIVSIGDVVKHRIDELEKDRNELVDYINAR
ncbi:MAG TPA: CBS domain-containing protein [Acidimicrobiales bacterium]|nr:CBS domain-containing protein [Acidimicrobiales bacterium]